MDSSHNAVIRVYDAAGNVIETYEHKGVFKEWGWRSFFGPNKSNLIILSANGGFDTTRWLFSFEWRSGDCSMAKAIYDQFSAISVSRQRRYQLRHHSRGLCVICCKPALNSAWFCDEHAVAKRERQRAYSHCKRRYKNARSYA